MHDNGFVQRHGRQHIFQGQIIVAEVVCLPMSLCWVPLGDSLITRVFLVLAESVVSLQLEHASHLSCQAASITGHFALGLEPVALILGLQATRGVKLNEVRVRNDGSRMEPDANLA